MWTKNKNQLNMAECFWSTSAIIEMEHRVKFINHHIGFIACTSELHCLLYHTSPLFANHNTVFSACTEFHTLSLVFINIASYKHPLSWIRHSHIADV